MACKTSDYIDFDKAKNTGLKLLKDPKKKIYGRYIIIAIHTGLRNSDIIRLSYEDLRQESFTLKEKKTGKIKIVDVHPIIHSILEPEATGKLFTTQKGTQIGIQYLNVELKRIFKIESKRHNISTHSLRKTFGRRIYENNNESEKALMYLMDLFNHTSLVMTKKYLGIRQEELKKIYMSL